MFQFKPQIQWSLLFFKHHSYFTLFVLYKVWLSILQTMFRKLFQSHHFQKGVGLIENNKPKEAIRSLKAAIENNENLASSHYNLGLAYYLEKQPTLALQEWKKSIAIEPQVDALVNLANAYLLDKKSDVAIRYYEQAIELSPDDGQVHFNLGAAYESNGHMEKALNAYREARDYGIEEAQAHFRNVAAKLLKFNSEH